MRFQHAHVTIAVCQPSRSAMMTGRYPHRSGGEGFYHLREPGVPILPELLRTAGYGVGILGKVGHSTPYAEFQWDMTYDMNDLGHGRNPALYRDHAAEFIAGAKTARRPFFLMANSHDPHRPFYGNDKQEWYEAREVPAAVPPSRAFIPDEVTTPGFLADLPEVRLEISEYYSSVRRCDDTVGALLEVLRDSGLEQNTLVVFLSDNGMAFPFAKTNCYLQSTRTPWIARWPRVVGPGTSDTTHFVSGIDILPTVLEATGIEPPGGIDGSSFLPLLRGEQQAGREYVFTQFHQNAGRWNYPMRCVQDTRFGYIFNPWSNGERIFRNESQAGRTMAAMQAAAEGNTDLAARVELFLYRVPEELYDFEHDPDALHNLADDPRYADDLDRLRGELESWMERYGDPALAAFHQRQSAEARETYTQSMANTIGGRA
jgi:N-sulfoglucosamine sulfohydrolase